MEQRYVVTEKWEMSYPAPIVLQKGDRIVVDYSVRDTTPGWDNWVWCTAVGGSAGWAPSQILTVIGALAEDRKEALVSEDYSAAELTVEKGEILIGTRILNGWVWCRHPRKNTAGWVPLNNVRLV